RRGREQVARPRDRRENARGHPGTTRSGDRARLSRCQHTMADKATIARPYAKAAFEHAQEHASLERWSKVLAAGAAVVSEPAVEKLLAHPRVELDAIVDLIAEVAGDSFDEHGRN